MSPEHAAGAGVLRAEQVASITAALVVAAGVVFYDWPAFTVLALYWIENVVIGIGNVARLLSVGFGSAAIAPEGGAPAAAGSGRVGRALTTLVMVPFFCVHYGMFCLVHGIFVVALFGDPAQAKDVFFDAPLVLVGHVLGDGWGALALVAIVVAVLIDTLRWLGGVRRGEERPTPASVMHGPYGRIVVLHVVLIAGGFLMQVTRAPQSAVLLLTAFKLVYDLRALRRRAGSAASASVTGGAS